MKGDVKSVAEILSRTDLATPLRPAARHLAEFTAPSFAFVVALAAVPSRRCSSSNEGRDDAK
jgi:uncharacterized membrane protein